MALWNCWLAPSRLPNVNANFRVLFRGGEVTDGETNVGEGQWRIICKMMTKMCVQCFCTQQAMDIYGHDFRVETESTFHALHPVVNDNSKYNSSRPMHIHAHGDEHAHDWIRYWLVPWASCQIRKIAGCACAGNARNLLPATAGERVRHASRHVRDARAVMHVGIDN